MATQTIYQFDTMLPGQLLDFALSLPAEFNLTAFNGGLIVREVGSSDATLLVTIAAQAVAAETGEDNDLELLAAIELACNESARSAIESEGLQGMDAETIEGDRLNDLWPDLEFARLGTGACS